QVAIDETNRRRKVQEEYNAKHGIVPRTVLKSRDAIFTQTRIADTGKGAKKYYIEEEQPSLAADPVTACKSRDELPMLAGRRRNAMEKAAREREFSKAARVRDAYLALQKLLDERTS